MPTRPPLTPAQIEALQARFALRVGARLEEGSRLMPHEVSERLRVARRQAVAQARQAALQRLPERVAAAGTVVVPQQGLALAGAGGSSSGGAFPAVGQPGATRPASGQDAPTSWGWRLASALPVLALVAGLWGIQAWHKHQQVRAAADVDAELLTDDLPPSAYSDPGFEEYLRTGPSASSSGEAGLAQDNPAAALLTDEFADDLGARDEGRAAPQGSDAAPAPASAEQAPTLELTSQAPGLSAARLSLGLAEPLPGFSVPPAVAVEVPRHGSHS